MKAGVQRFLLVLGLLLLAGTGTALATFNGGAAVAAPVETAALAAPGGLSIVGTTLSWTPSASAWASGTRVYRGTTSGGPYTQIAQLAGLGSTSYADAPGSGAFFYVVRAYYSGNGANWTSAVSNEKQLFTAASLTLTQETAGPGAVLTGFAGDLPSNDTVTFHYDSPSGPVLAGTFGGVATPTGVGPDGEGSVTVVLPSGAGSGNHTIYAVTAPGGAVTSDTVMVDADPPPTPTYSPPPGAATNATSASFAFSSSESGVTFSCSSDGVAATPCTSPVALSNLAEGPHSFSVTATDAYGNKSPAAIHSYVVDQTAPAAPVLGATPAAATTSTAASFSFPAAEPDLTFLCGLDGATPTPCTSPTNFTVTNGTHTFVVQARDAAGNSSDPTSYSWVVDTAGLRAIVTEPRNGSWLNFADYSAACGTPAGDLCGLAINGTGGRNVSRVEVSILRSNGSRYWDGNSFGSGTEVFVWATGTSSWTLPIAANEYQQSTYTMRVRVRDQNGTYGPITSTTWHFDNTAPTTTSTPVNGGDYNAARWLANCATPVAADMCGTAVDPAIGAAGGSGVTSVQISLRSVASGLYWTGSAFASAGETLRPTSGTTSWTSPFAYADFPADGDYTLRVVATDLARNSSSLTSTFTVDSTPPTGSITFPVDGGSYGISSYTNGCATGAAADLCGSAADPGTNVAMVQYSLQRGNGLYWNGSSYSSASEVRRTATGTTSWTTAVSVASYPSDGVYTLRLYPTDGAGNTALASSHTFTLDKTPPPAPAITSAPTNPTGASTATFAFTDSEPGLTFTCKLDAGPATACSDSVSYAGLAQGSHTVVITATDALGNTSSTSRTWTVDLTGPSTTVTSPAAGPYSAAGYDDLCGTADVGDVCGTAADTGGSAVAVVSVSLQQSATGLYWNGTSFSSPTELRTTATGTTSWKWGLAGSAFPASGNYVVRAAATDGVGNLGSVTTRTFAVDITPPSAIVTFPVDGMTYGPTAWREGCSTATTSEVCVAASDPGSGIDQMRVSMQQGNGNYYDGGSFGSSFELTYAVDASTLTYPFAFTEFPANGAYTFRARVTDGAGNTTLSANTFFVDRTPPPATSITSGPANPTNASTAAFTFTNAESGVTFGCKLDTGAVAPCSSGVSYSGLTQGSHTVVVTATDPYGNSSSASRSWLVDTSAPAVTVSSPTAASVHSVSGWNNLCTTAGAGDACGTAADTGGAGIAAVQVSLQQDGGGYWDGTAFASPTELRSNAVGTTSWRWGFDGAAFPSSGSYVLRAVSLDAAGNASAVLSRTFAVDLLPPTPVLTFPADGATYDSAAWNAGCGTASTGDLCGTASDAGGAGVSTVTVSIRQGSGNYWNGSAFASAAETLLPTSGTTTWTRAMPASALPAGSYTVRVVATDAVGNNSSISSTFSSGPRVALVRTIVSTSVCTGPSISAAVPADGVPTGRRLIARVVLRGSTTGPVTVTDSRGNAWTSDADVTGTGVRTLVLSSPVTTALQSGDSVNLSSPSGASANLVVGEWSGLAATGAFDARGTATGSTSNVTGSVTTTGPDDLVIGVLGSAATASFTDASGWTAMSSRTTTGCGSTSTDNRGAHLLGVPAGTATYAVTLGPTNWALAVVGYQAG